MKYMLLIYSDENAWTQSEMEQCYQDSVKLTQKLHANGQYLGASPLHSVAMATSVRVRDGKKLVTDGPFAETREQLGGYFLIDAQDLDEAISIAFHRLVKAPLKFARSSNYWVNHQISNCGLFLKNILDLSILRTFIRLDSRARISG